MKSHHYFPQLLLLLSFFLNVDSYAQNGQRNSDGGYDISIVSKGQGRVICNGQYTVGYDDRKEFTLKNNADVRLKFSPKEGYELSKLTINGIIRGQDIEDNQITLKDISKKTVIVATFSEENHDDSVKLTIVSGSGGTLSYDGKSIDKTKKVITVKKGTTINLKCNPQEGFELEKLSVNGILRDVSDNAYSFEILRNSVVKATFSASPSVSPPTVIETSVENRPKFEIKVCGPGEVAFRGEINGIVAGNPESPFLTNKEEFYVNNGSDVTIKLSPVQNIKRLVIGYKDLTQTVKASDGAYTVGVIHDHPETGRTSVSVEFTQRYSVTVAASQRGSYKPLGDLQETRTPHRYLVDKGGQARLWLSADLRCHLERLTVNGADMTSSATPSQTVVTGGGPTYELNLGSVGKDYSVVATFAADPDPTLTIVCGQNGTVDRAMHIDDPTQYIHHSDPDYTVNAGQSATFYEPSAAKTSNFYGKPWVLRTVASPGYELGKIVVNGTDMTSLVKRVPPDGSRHIREICYLSLGDIKSDTRVVLSFVKAVQKEQKVEWVDLGTGVLWATCNVGASKPTDAGNYYTWKEAKELLVPKGRLPTYDEILRLKEDCRPRPDQVGNVKGFRFYHKSDASISIFIPAAGGYPEYETKHTNPNKLEVYGEEGVIWSSAQSGAGQKTSKAMKELTMDPILLMIGDAFSLDGYDRVALLFSIKEKNAKLIDADIGSRLSVRLVLDK